ncbi:hypothetical protein BH24ACT3_BH24ACT3_02240 [soil metagenome]
MLGRRLIRRQRDGSFKVNLAERERELLRTLADQLSNLLGSDDPSLRRLSPPAYLDDAEADAEFQRLMGEDLETSRRAQLTLLAESAEATELDEEQVLAWMGAVNGLRLVLGTRLDVSEEFDEDSLRRLDPDDPETAALAVYHYLGWLLEHLVRAVGE